MLTSRDFIIMLRRRLALFLGVTFAITALSIVIAAILPPSFQSELKLIVNRPQIPNELAESTVQVSDGEQLQIFESRLLTRAHLIDIATRISVLPQLAEMSSDQIVEAMRRRTKITSSTGRNRATLMTLGFRARDANAAADVLGEYLTLIRREDSAYRTGRAAKTEAFFRTEVARLSSRLDQQSARILAFKTEHAGALPDSLDHRRSLLLTQQDRLTAIERDLTRLMMQSETFARDLAALPTPATLPAESPRARHHAEVAQELTAALAVYTETSPKVIALRNRLAKAARHLAETKGNEPPLPSPARATLSRHMAEVAHRRDELMAQRAALRAELTRLTEGIERTATNALTLDALEHDNENLQAQYTQSVDRLARAATGERIEDLSRDQRITIIEQPTRPSRPSGPNRRLIVAGGATLGVLAAAGLVAALEMLSGTVRHSGDLIRRLGVTPIATIPLLHTPRELRRRRVTRLALIALLVALIPAGIALWRQVDVPFDQIAAHMLARFERPG